MFESNADSTGCKDAKFSKENVEYRKNTQFTHYCPNCEALAKENAKLRAERDYWKDAAEGTSELYANASNDLARYKTADAEGRLYILEEKQMPRDCKMHFKADYLGVGRCKVEGNDCEGYANSGGEPCDSCKGCEHQPEEREAIAEEAALFGEAAAAALNSEKCLCENCGNELETNIKICSACGTERAALEKGETK